jgi:hypothetical protein
MFRPYEFDPDAPMRAMQSRLDAWLEAVAGAALPQPEPTPAKVEPATPSLREPANNADTGRPKIKRADLLALVKALPTRVAADLQSQLARQDALSHAEQTAEAAAAADEVRCSTPKQLALLLEQRGHLSDFSYTIDSVRVAIARLMNSGDLPGFMGGKSHKAAPAIDDADGESEHDVDAEFAGGTGTAHAGDGDRGTPAARIRNRLHKAALPEEKAARRGGRLSRDRMQLRDADGQLTDGHVDADAFWQQHPELEEG